MDTNAISLRDVALAAYRARPAYITTKEIAEAIDRTPQWVRMFGRGEFENPGVVTIERLIAYIKSRKEA